MLGKIVTYVGPVCFLVVLLSGCTTTPYGNEAISLEELEGVWGGYADSQLATTRVTCTIRIPITFEVKDGRAISLCNDPRCLFDVALKENGGIKFVYKKAIPFEEGGTGVISHRDIHFEGQLSTSNLGKGSFAVSGCVGKWEVTKQTTDRLVTELRDLSSSVRAEFNNYLSDPKYIDFKSFSVNPNTGRWGRSWASVSPELAAIRAKALCEKRGDSCITYSIGNIIVSDMGENEISSVMDEYYRSIVLEEDQSISGDSLSNIQILSYLRDKTLNGVTANGLKFTVHYSANGAMQGELKTKIHGSNNLIDHGNWDVTNGKLCRQWTNWLNGMRRCSEVYKEGSVLRSYDSDRRLYAKITLPNKEAENQDNVLVAKESQEQAKASREEQAQEYTEELREQKTAVTKITKSTPTTRMIQNISELLSQEEIEALFAKGSKKTVRARRRQGWNTYKLSCSKDRWCHLGSYALVISPVSEEGTFSISSNDHWIKWLLSRKAKAIRKGDGSIHIIDHVYAKPQTMWIIDK